MEIFFIDICAVYEARFAKCLIDIHFCSVFCKGQILYCYEHYIYSKYSKWLCFVFFLNACIVFSDDRINKALFTILESSAL